MRFSQEQLDSRIKGLQDYLGPRVNYTSDRWPNYQPERWLMEYLDILKKRKYRRLRKLCKEKI